MSLPTANAGSGMGLAEPPEGAIVGEDVPRENEEYEAREAQIKRVYRTLKANRSGTVDDAALREKAEEIVDKRLA